MSQLTQEQRKNSKLMRMREDELTAQREIAARPFTAEESAGIRQCSVEFGHGHLSFAVPGEIKGRKVATEEWPYTYGRVYIDHKFVGVAREGRLLPAKESDAVIEQYF